MTHETVQIRTDDGNCPVHVFGDGTSKLPAAIMYMDAFGIRPAMFELAETLASSGYRVLLPDLYYRIGWTAKDAEGIFEIPEKRDFWMKTVMPTVSAGNVMKDVPALLAYIDRRGDASDEKIGMTGYCLGGRLAFVAAGEFPDRVAAAAAYHPGGLVTDAPDSPHKLAPQIKGSVYVGAAKEDRGFTDEQKATLDQALSAAKVDHKIETYDAHHGFVPSDTPAHNEAAAKKHWQTLLDLFGRTLGGRAT